MRLYYDRLVDLLIPYGAEVFNKAAIEQLVALVEDCYRDNPMQYEKIQSGFSTIVRSNLSKGVLIKITLVQGEHGMVSLSVENFKGQHLVTIVEHATDPVAHLHQELPKRRVRNYPTRTGALVPVQVPRGRLQLVACYPEQREAITNLVIKHDKMANKTPAVVFTMAHGAPDPAELVRMVREYALFRTVDLILVYPLQPDLARHEPITYWADKEAFLNCPRLDLEASHVVFAELIDGGAACRATVTRCRPEDKTSNGTVVTIPLAKRKTVYEMLSELFPGGENTVSTEALLEEFINSIADVAAMGLDPHLTAWVADVRQHWSALEAVRYTHDPRTEQLFLTAVGSSALPPLLYHCRNPPH
jgi:hypothetical protein